MDLRVASAALCRRVRVGSRAALTTAVAYRYYLYV